MGSLSLYNIRDVLFVKVEVTGGPQPSGSVHFTISDVEAHNKHESIGPVARVSDSGIVEAFRLGVAELRAEAHGMEVSPTTTTTEASTDGDSLKVYSVDRIFVHVVNLTGVLLQSPVKTLVKGQLKAVCFSMTLLHQ